MKNHYSGVNFIDVYHRTGLYPLPLPFVPGREGAGVVEAVGDGVQHVRVGDRVAYFSAGSYAEYTLASASTTSVLPAKVTLEQGAIAHVAGITTLMLAQEIYRVKRGDYVLVHAAAGGVGQALCQFCAHVGAVVIGTTSSEMKAAIARQAGAQHVILYNDGGLNSVIDQVMALTKGAGCRVVFDGVGKATFEQSLAACGIRGLIACFGNASGKPDAFDVTRLTKGSKMITRPTMADFIRQPEDYQRLISQVYQLQADGVLRFAVDSHYQLADAAQAHRDLEGRKTTGKLALRIGQ